jgi:tripartite-type tricarboxylate transporter receptor subunit TctC
MQKKNVVRNLSCLLVGIGLSVGVSLNALAQAWPNKPVTIIVPWPAGGPSDTAARPLSKALSENLGQTFLIDNRGGAGGNIGSAAVAKSAPDGYTLLITSSAPIVINPSLYKKMPFDPDKELQPITNLIRVPLVLAVNPSLPVHNLKELIGWVKAQNGNTVYASAGNGTPQHMTGELFKSLAKLDITHVPYKGSAPAITDLLGGHVPMMFDSTVAINSYIKEGKLRAIAVSGAKRSPLFPDVPTFIESGFPTLESYAWYGMLAPAGLPKDLLVKINTETLKAMKQPDFQRVLAETGSEFVGTSPEQFQAFIKSESAKWARVVKESGATVD